MKYTFIRSVIPVAAAICLTACGRSSDAAEPLPDAVEDAVVVDAAEGETAIETGEGAVGSGAEAEEDVTAGEVASETGVSTEDSEAASEAEGQDAAEADNASEAGESAVDSGVASDTGEDAAANASKTEAASAHNYEYTKETSTIVKKLMKCNLKASDTSEMQSLLDDMKASDPAMGDLWEGIMNYWIYTENSLEINYDNLPDDLPDDDSLCIVMAGYELGRDGKMKPELVDRMVTGLACARKYPNAYILVTGGPTAHDKNNTTEAGAMAAWLVDHGVDEKRLLVEEKALSTAHNATYGNALIREKAPQVRSLAVVTSDYHVGLVSLLFYAETQRYAYETGTTPFDIISNAASRVDDPGEKISHGLAATLLSNVMEP